ncbi:MAG: glycerol-3-phosphate dehydrogenase [Legionella sp.]|uniref:glycerol-3-phosphate dehydrogenase n=1 Tax=Legionella sp. TaxID=459 RepID=UPI00283BC024|nr:glycerol-3-phosphate dehydrogenase [Legionella sp.]
MDQVFDVAIIGGGINGCGCAADAALRGLSVVLIEQDDLASKTSSNSTKLVHGGLRYLENYEFALVRKALTERQRLFDLAPHLVHAQPLVLPYEKHMRPSWFLRLGLFLYDHLSSKNRLPKCKSINRKNEVQYFSPLKEGLERGFLFYDGAADDARLTIANALQAKLHGASIHTRSTVIKTHVINNLWHVTIQPQSGPAYTIQARTLINAAGPWVKSVEQLTHIPDQQKISLVKGSHILVPKLYEGEHAYFLQHEDKRVIFVIPYHGYSMIGTTDVPLNEPLDQIHISDEEINYLIKLVNTHFKTKISKNDIVYTWSGVRALLANESKEARALSRDYNYEFQLKPAPIITIYGGKITTYRQLAEEAINQFSTVFSNLKPSITENAPLPGATFGTMDFAQYIQYAQKKYSWMNKELLHRYLYTYGSYMEKFLSLSTSEKSLGKNYGSGLYQAEVDYLILEEWARSSEDVLRRRTKLDLTLNAARKKELAAYIESIIAYHPLQTEPLLH